MTDAERAKKNLTMVSATVHTGFAWAYSGVITGGQPLPLSGLPTIQNLGEGLEKGILKNFPYNLASHSTFSVAKVRPESRMLAFPAFNRVLALPQGSRGRQL